MSDKDPMSPDDRPVDEDEIEILEVVGFDDDAPPSAPDDGSESNDGEVEVRFDEDMWTGSTAADLSPPSADDDRERLLRLRADFENFQKRVEREKREFYIHATSELVGRLLPVLDNFERAVSHAEGSDAVEESFVEGVRLIRKQLVEELSRQGLREVEAIGRPFDPAVHEAVATDRVEQCAPNTVLAELQRGYFFHDRLLRPALVKVNLIPEINASESGSAGAGSGPTES
jgi:molecular chaperone GrpE